METKLWKWQIVYKVESYGNVVIDAVDAEQAWQKFEVMQPESLIEEAPVTKVRMMGIEKKNGRSL